MSGAEEQDRLKIGHVLFIDIVGYSDWEIDHVLEQRVHTAYKRHAQ